MYKEYVQVHIYIHIDSCYFCKWWVCLWVGKSLVDHRFRQLIVLFFFFAFACLPNTAETASLRKTNSWTIKYHCPKHYQCKTKNRRFTHFLVFIFPLFTSKPIWHNYLSLSYPFCSLFLYIPYFWPLGFINKTNYKLYLLVAQFWLEFIKDKNKVYKIVSIYRTDFSNQKTRFDN